jgi:RecA/RadA recombinase
MKQICEWDQKSFQSKREDARFCSPKCRVAAARQVGADPETGEIICNTTPVNVTDNVTDNSEIAAKAERLGITVKEYERRMASFVKMGMVKTEWITTGIAEFDALTRIPRGRVTQIQGPYAVGKTTLCLNMIKGLKGIRVLYIDSEAALNPELLMELGIDDRQFTLWNESAYIEDIYDQVVAATKSGKYDLVIIDSLAACTFKTEEANDSTASNIGQKAKIVNKMMRIVPMQCKNTDTALVIINQEREMIGTYVPIKYTPGGMGPVYAASLIVSLKTIKSWRFPDKPKDNIYLGHAVEATIIKSKVNNPWRVAKFKLYYPQPVAQAPDKPKVELGAM